MEMVRSDRLLRSVFERQVRALLAQVRHHGIEATGDLVTRVLDDACRYIERVRARRDALRIPLEGVIGQLLEARQRKGEADAHGR